jgi:hypothetical protein
VRLLILWNGMSTGRNNRVRRLRELAAAATDSAGIAARAEEAHIGAGHELRRAGSPGIEDRVHQ